MAMDRHRRLPAVQRRTNCRSNVSYVVIRVRANIMANLHVKDVNHFSNDPFAAILPTHVVAIETVRWISIIVINVSIVD